MNDFKIWAKVSSDEIEYLLATEPDSFLGGTFLDLDEDGWVLLGVDVDDLDAKYDAYWEEYDYGHWELSLGSYDVTLNGRKLSDESQLSAIEYLESFNREWNQ